MMIKLLGRLAAILALAGGAPTDANTLVEQTYAQKYAEASLVVVGRVSRHLPETTSRYGLVSEVVVLSTLKGRRFQHVRIYTTSPDVEGDPNCCRIGTTYLMFLGRGHSEIYSSINGRYGFVPVG
jgi:hypothetical protein